MLRRQCLAKGNQHMQKKCFTPIWSYNHGQSIDIAVVYDRRLVRRLIWLCLLTWFLLWVGDCPCGWHGAWIWNLQLWSKERGRLRRTRRRSERSKLKILTTLTRQVGNKSRTFPICPGKTQNVKIWACLHLIIYTPCLKKRHSTCKWAIPKEIHFPTIPFSFASLCFSQFASGVFNLQSHQPASAGTTQCISLNSECWHTPLSNIPGRREVRCLTRSKNFIGFQDSRLQLEMTREKTLTFDGIVCCSLSVANWKVRIYHQMPPRCKGNPNPWSCRRSASEIQTQTTSLELGAWQQLCLQLNQGTNEGKPHKHQPLQPV